MLRSLNSLPAASGKVPVSAEPAGDWIRTRLTGLTNALMTLLNESAPSTSGKVVGAAVGHLMVPPAGVLQTSANQKMWWIAPGWNATVAVPSVSAPLVALIVFGSGLLVPLT